MAHLGPALFGSTPKRDYLSLFENGKLNKEKVIRVLNYNKKDVAAALDVPVKSIRYDERMPRNVQQRFEEWASTINLVGSYFEDVNRTIQWFQVSNPQLGGISPSNISTETSWILEVVLME